MRQLSVIVLCMLVAGNCLVEEVLGQEVQFGVSIALQWGSKVDTVTVGVNGGSSSPLIAEGSYGLDDVALGIYGPFGRYGESSGLGDPDGNRVSLRDVAGRTEIQAAGRLAGYDYRPYSSPSQIDTFIVQVEGPIVEVNNLTLTWPSASTLTQYGDAWTLHSVAPSTPSTSYLPGSVLVNMLSVTTYTFSANNPVRFGIVKTGARVTGVNDGQTGVPTNYDLENNYPNPFNPTTLIRFSIAESGPVALTVFNLLGQEIATLVNEPRGAGTHTVSFNAADISTGVYFYKLQTRGFSAVKKMMVVK